MIILSDSGCESGCMMYLGIILAPVIFILLYAMHLEHMRKIECQKLKLIYESALQALKNDPNNSNFRQQALQAGRNYALQARKVAGQHGVTVFDEVALMNDLNAISTTSKYSNLPNSSSSSSQTIEDRLAQLEYLKNKRLISNQEYLDRRSKILDDI